MPAAGVGPGDGPSRGDLGLAHPSGRGAIGWLPDGRPGVRSAATELRANEVQDLADVIAELTHAAAGYGLRLRVLLELGEGSDIPPDVIDKVNAVLAKVKEGWVVGD